MSIIISCFHSLFLSWVYSYLNNYICKLLSLVLIISFIKSTHCWCLWAMFKNLCFSPNLVSVLREEFGKRYSIESIMCFMCSHLPSLVASYELTSSISDALGGKGSLAPGWRCSQAHDVELVLSCIHVGSVPYFVKCYKIGFHNDWSH